MIPRVTNITPNPITHFTPVSYRPNVSPQSFINPRASVIGNVIIADNVLVSPFASIRGDEGTPIYIGKGTNVQDGVIIHGLKDKYVNQNNRLYSVYVGKDTSLAHQAQVHGPAKVGDRTFVGMKSLVFQAEVGDDCVVEPGAIVMGVKVPNQRYIPAGMTVTTQAQANNLPVIDKDYANKHLNEEVVEVNKELNTGYQTLNAYPQNYYLN